MSATQPLAKPGAWKQSRYAFVLSCVLSLVFLSLLLRSVLFAQFQPPHPAAGREVAGVFLIGLHRDVFIGLLFSLPLLVWFWVIPEGWFSARWHRWLLFGVFTVFWAGEIFLVFAEYFFFEEFRSRFNTVAVDYLLYPHEVFINIWDTYPVVWVIGACALVSILWTLLLSKVFSGVWTNPITRRARFVVLCATLLVAAAWSRSVSLKEIHISQERVLNEIANNGALSFFTAFWTRNLDFSEFYRTIPREQAYGRVRRLLAEPNATFDAKPDSIRRRVVGDPTRPRLNVVLILEESLGSEFWGVLGRKEETLTPEMDRLAVSEGILFTNVYASGNRTVRGLEGVLSSFPPLPGDSIVKRDLSDNVETVARVLKRDGYATLFLYGGRGVFDGMRSFALNNGYDRFIEQKHFEHPTHATIWGVCDEDIFDRSIEECRTLARAGTPFLATMLSVSNHKPYTYPKGRIPENPEDRKRNHAVKYSDYALGRFFKAARQEPFWTNTVFVVVADHGARVYGSQRIPIHSYEIPLVILGPAVAPQPRRIPNLGCSLDVAPTILGLIGRPYDSLFFGRDLLDGNSENERVLINHNRDIGLFARDRLVVFGLRKSTQLYTGDPKKDELMPVSSLSPRDEEMATDAVALFQVADDLYSHRQFRLDSSTAMSSRSPDVTHR